MTTALPYQKPPILLDKAYQIRNFHAAIYATLTKMPQVRDKLRVKHYSIRTEQAYVDWIKRYIFFHDKRHPRDMGVADVKAFLTHLAVAGRVSENLGVRSCKISPRSFYDDICMQNLVTGQSG